jgi:hypothetical protein
MRPYLASLCSPVSRGLAFVQCEAADAGRRATVAPDMLPMSERYARMALPLNLPFLH